MNSKRILLLSLLCACLAFALPAIAQTVEPSKPALMVYTKRVMSIIGPPWYCAVDRNRDNLTPGTARFTFRITPEGRVENLRLVSNTPNQFLAEVSAHAIKQAKLAAISKTVLNEAGQNWIDFDLPFKIFPR
jgi:hypothetical protein